MGEEDATDLARLDRLHFLPLLRVHLLLSRLRRLLARSISFFLDKGDGVLGLGDLLGDVADSTGLCRHPDEADPKRRRRAGRHRPSVRQLVDIQGKQMSAKDLLGSSKEKEQSKTDV